MNDPAPSHGRQGPGEAPAKAPPYSWFMLVVLVLIYACSSIDRMVLSVVIEPLKHEFHLSDKQIGILGGIAFSAPFAIASLPVGWLIDRVNRRVLLSIIVTIWSGLTMTGAAAGNFIALLCARIGVGAAEAGAHPASLSLAADLFPRAVFLVAGIPGVIFGMIALTSFKEPVRGGFDPPREGGPLKNLSISATLGLVGRSPSSARRTTGGWRPGASWSSRVMGAAGWARPCAPG